MCLPLGPHGSVIHEIWELINLSAETHNFHIHQTKFIVFGTPASGSQNVSTAIRQDNVPVPFAVANIPEEQNGYCTVDQWRGGQCTSHPIVIDVPFSQPGEFVFHCHILEHEDSGMMARIRILPNP